MTSSYGDGGAFTTRMAKCSARLWGLHAAGARGLDVAWSNLASPGLLGAEQGATSGGPSHLKYLFTQNHHIISNSNYFLQ